MKPNLENPNRTASLNRGHAAPSVIERGHVAPSRAPGQALSAFGSGPSGTDANPRIEAIFREAAIAGIRGRGNRVNYHCDLAVSKSGDRWARRNRHIFIGKLPEDPIAEQTEICRRYWRALQAHRDQRSRIPTCFGIYDHTAHLVCLGHFKAEVLQLRRLTTSQPTETSQ